MDLTLWAPQQIAVALFATIWETPVADPHAALSTDTPTALLVAHTAATARSEPEWSNTSFVDPTLARINHFVKF